MAEFFLKRGEQVFGPMSVVHVKECGKRGQIGPGDALAQDIQGPWIPVEQVTGLVLKSEATETLVETESPVQAGSDDGNTVVRDITDYFRKITKQGTNLAKGLIKKGRDTYSTALQEAFASDTTILIPIKDKVVIGRDREDCDYQLEHSQVSRWHTRVERAGERYVVTDLGSSNGTYLNGSLIGRKEELNSGDVLNIGPFSFTFDGEALIRESGSATAEIICSGLCKQVTDRSTGSKILILNDVSLVIKPREFTVIIGPSGGGKSTLLNALSGRSPATSGVVLVNGQNLYTHFDALKKSMALVPQKDVLHNELRLRKALLYTAKLRLPPDLGSEACAAIVDEYLETVTLTERQGTAIKDLSGGQVKRASLANEIISQPNLLFVDEATSGLDEHTDGEIMQIFRQIAEDGKTVVCITHNLTNVEKYCHKVVILAPGGYLAFIGTADEAIRYFDIRTLGDVYIKLRDRAPEEWKKRFAATPGYRQMYGEVKQHDSDSSRKIGERRRQSFTQKSAIFLRQLILLAERGWEIQLSDLRSLSVMVLQCVFIAALMCILFGEIPAAGYGLQIEAERADFCARVIFLLTISSYWFGCNNAAKEIVKDKEIYERERDVCLNVISYYTAKLLMLAVMTVIQVVLLLYLVGIYTGLPGTFSSQVISISLIGICGVCTGLLISTISKNTDMAVTLVPVAIIPQVILAGLIWPIDGFAEFLSNLFISCYWGYGNLMGTLPDGIAETAGYGEWSFLSAGIIIMHTVLLVAAANAFLYAADKRLSLKGTGIDKWLKTAAKTLQARVPHLPSRADTQDDINI